MASDPVDEAIDIILTDKAIDDLWDGRPTDGWGTDGL